MDKAAVQPLVRVRDLKMHFPIHSGILRRHTGDVKAVDGISFDILKGETLGLVGESGCGKSTVGRAILRLYEPTAGSVEIDGEDVAKLSPEALRRKRPQMQMVFQDPQASLNPRMTVTQIIAEPLDEHTDWTAARKQDRVLELMDAVGLNRLFAYVLNLTPAWQADWGGTLIFVGDDGHVDQGYSPAFNALNLFRVPTRHAVTQVAGYAAANRLAITGWVRAR